jgi:hypothetical protein
MNQTLNFQDLIKNSFLKTDLFGTINFADILLGLSITLIISIYIFNIYRKTYGGVVYSYNFNATLVLMPLITCLIIMTISSNLVLSLGMVGALSIVRFRTAVKEPLDTVFMFWALATGITTGARLYVVAVICSLFIGITILILMRFKNSNNVFMLVVHYNEEARDKVFRELDELDYKIKSKTVSRGITELTLELRLIGSDTSFIDEISEIQGVVDASLISYNGNFIE